MAIGSKSARDKLRSVYKKKDNRKNVLAEVGSKSAYSKLKKTSTKAGAIEKLKKVGGGSAKVSSTKNPRSGTKSYTTKELQTYKDRAKKVYDDYMRKLKGIKMPKMPRHFKRKST